MTRPDSDPCAACGAPWRQCVCGQPEIVEMEITIVANHPIVLLLDPRANEGHVGYVPTFLMLDDPRPAAEQFQERYLYGGWRPQEGFTKGQERFVLHYPGDPPLVPIAAMQLRDETIIVYWHGYVAIWQKDGSFEACRMD